MATSDEFAQKMAQRIKDQEAKANQDHQIVLHNAGVIRSQGVSAWRALSFDAKEYLQKLGPYTSYTQEGDNEFTLGYGQRHIAVKFDPEGALITYIGNAEIGHGGFRPEVDGESLVYYAQTGLTIDGPSPKGTGARALTAQEMAEKLITKLIG